MRCQVQKLNMFRLWLELMNLWILLKLFCIRFLHRIAGNEPHLTVSCEKYIFTPLFRDCLIVHRDKRETVALRNQACYRNIEPTWLQPEQQFPSPTSTVHGKSAWNRRKRRRVWACAHDARLSIFFSGSEFTSQARPHGAAATDPPSTHATAGAAHIVAPWIKTNKNPRTKTSVNFFFPPI